jgi:tetratricopeptide (TPR) repeat protein
MAQILSRLARKKEQTDRIGKYLMAGIDAASKSSNSRDAKNLVVLRADYALYAEKDTLRAIEIKKEALDPQWKRKPDEFYGFAKWCAERKINLREADFYASEAVKLAYEGEFKAKVLSTLASIRYAQGLTDEAIDLIERAIEQDPEKESYFDQLREYKNYKGN